MKDWKTLKGELLKNKDVLAQYEKLQPRYQLISQLLEMRLRNGLTQEKLAKKIGTKQEAIARLESGHANPTIDFLEKITQALGSRLVIQVR